MRPRSAKSLADARLACERILEVVGRFDRERYLEDWEAQSSVAYQFMIVGESLVRLRDEERPVFDRIGEAKNAISFRNFLIHGYDAVVAHEVWDTAHENVPPLLAVLTELLDEASGQAL